MVTGNEIQELVSKFILHTINYLMVTGEKLGSFLKKPPKTNNKHDSILKVQNEPLETTPYIAVKPVALRFEN